MPDYVHDLGPTIASISFQIGYPLDLSLFGNASVGISIVALTPTLVRVTFSRAVVDNDVVRNPRHYAITPTDGSPAVSVLGVEPENSPLTQMLVYTTELRQNGQYTLTIQSLEAE